MNDTLNVKLIMTGSDQSDQKQRVVNLIQWIQAECLLDNK